MEKDPEKQIVIYNTSFGFGPHFSLAQAVWNAKTVTYYLHGDNGRRSLRRTQLFAVATLDLAVEAKAINDAGEKLADRARKFKAKLREAMPK